MEYLASVAIAAGVLNTFPKGLLGRKIDPKDARAYQLILMPAGKKSAMQVVRTLDRLQAAFEKGIGVAELRAALQVIRQVEQICTEK